VVDKDMPNLIRLIEPLVPPDDSTQVNDS